MDRDESVHLSPPCDHTPQTLARQCRCTYLNQYSARVRVQTTGLLHYKYNTLYRSRNALYMSIKDMHQENVIWTRQSKVITIIHV